MSNIKLPRYLKWRDGRPRWEVGGRNAAAYRDAGFIARDLRTPCGDWLSLPAAITEATALNEHLDAWREGRAPTISTSTPAPAPTQAANALASVSALIADYKRSAAYARLRPASRESYVQYLAVLDTWAGQIAPRDITARWASMLYQNLLDCMWWRHQRGVIPLNASPHATYLAMPMGLREGVRRDRLAAIAQEMATDRLAERRQAGVAMARQVIVLARTLWQHAVREHGLTSNPWASVQTVAPLGRAVAISNDDLERIVTMADQMGRPDVGDAFILGAHVGQRRADLVRIPRDVAFTGVLLVTQSKTGNVVQIPLSGRGRERMVQAVGRHTAPTILAHPDTGTSFEGDSRQITHRCNAVIRRLQALDPTFPRVTLHDTRDTALTRLLAAGNSLPVACAITGHSLRSGETIMRSYFAPDINVTRGGIEKMEAMLNSQGARW